MRKVPIMFGWKRLARENMEYPKWQIPRQGGKFKANSLAVVKNVQIRLKGGNKY